MHALKVILLIIVVAVVLVGSARWARDRLRRNCVKSTWSRGLGVRLGTINIGGRDYIDTADLIEILENTLEAAKKARGGRDEAPGSPGTES